MRLTALIACGLWLFPAVAPAQAPAPREIPEAVSYTHLTLPTILLV